MSEEPDIVNEMRREEKLGRLQYSVQISSEELEIEEKSSENALGDSVSIFKEDVEKTKEKDFTIIRELKKEKRYSGVSVIGDISWGTHLCQFYKTKEDLLDILVPYFKAGLENNEFCIWFTSEPLSVDEAKSALGKVVKDLDDYITKGQIEILDYRSWYIKSGEFDSDGVLKRWVENEKKALKKGFDGLRLTGNTFWLEKQDWKAFKEYEEKVNRVIGKYHMLAICSYSLDKCGSSELLDVISNHQFALIRRNGTWEIIESSEHKLQSVFASSPDPIFSTDLNGNITDCNQATLDFIGVQSKEELFGTPDLSMLIENHRGKIAEHMRKCMDGSTIKDAEYTFIARNGRKIDSLVSASVLKDASGKPTGFMAVVKDITELKRTEAKLRKTESIRESAQRLQTVIDSAEDGITLSDAEGHFEIFNAKMYEITGYTREEANTSTDFTILLYSDPHERKKALENITETVKKGVSHNVETIIQSKDGTKKTLLVSTSVIQIDDRNMFLSVYRDITERKQAEKALEVSEMRYRRLFESAQDGIILLDFDTGMIMDVNPFLIDLLGYSKTDLLDKHLWEIGVFRDVIPSKDHFLELQTKEYIRYGDLPLQTKSGKKIDVEFVSNVYLVDSKKTIQCNIRDIAWRKQAEEELKAADEKLKESLQKIQNQKNELERKSTNLEEINKHLDGFAYSVSHDLRAPLRSVSGFSQVLLDEYKDKADDQMKHYLERIFTGAQKMGDLIDALLHFSRTTRADLQYETVDVEKIVTNIIKDQTAAHPERTIDFVVQPLPRVEADGKMVEVIFGNLIENAVKFSSKRKNAHIEIGSRQDKDEQQFFVKDNGVGFDMEFKNKLFGAFQRLHAENEFEGNGIGLATVARLVTKHGGRAWAEGEVDKGATFYFTLPLNTVDDRKTVP